MYKASANHRAVREICLERSAERTRCDCIKATI
jgi:hypothetical protein